jgi:DNA-binding NarL/FixJ family response regulator
VSDPASTPPRKALTTEERAILRALRDGLSLSQVASGRSEATIRAHIRNARAKLKIRGSEELRRMLNAGELNDEIAEPD